VDSSARIGPPPRRRCRRRTRRTPRDRYQLREAAAIPAEGVTVGRPRNRVLAAATRPLATTSATTGAT